MNEIRRKGQWWYEVAFRGNIEQKYTKNMWIKGWSRWKDVMIMEGLKRGNGNKMDKQSQIIREGQEERKNMKNLQDVTSTYKFKNLSQKGFLLTLLCTSVPRCER